MRRSSTLLLSTITFASALTLGLDAMSDDAPLKLNLRMRSRVEGSRASVEEAAWDPKKTAIIVCDMWDEHWCKSASGRVGELAKPLNEVVKEARRRGVFVIHAPSTTTAFYKDTPARRRALDAPFSPTPAPLSKAERWGTAWCWTDAKHEGVLPIDDTDMGCDCREKCTIRAPWTRQISSIEINDADAITDDGQEAWNLLAARGIDNVILCGVHLNMCVLGRPFGIRQMTALGKNVALMRDMTDTMYDPRRPPGVTHFEGTDLVIEHVEKYWCPTFTSADLTGSAPFHFRDDPRAGKIKSRAE